MQFYSFLPDLTKAYPILGETNLVISNNADPNLVQDTILTMLPKAFSMIGTKLRLSLVPLAIIKDCAYWDLIFTYPTDYDAHELLTKIFDGALELEDTYDHLICGEPGLCKISFKAG